MIPNFRECCALIEIVVVMLGIGALIYAVTHFVSKYW